MTLFLKNKKLAVISNLDKSDQEYRSFKNVYRSIFITKFYELFLEIEELDFLSEIRENVDFPKLRYFQELRKVNFD